MKTFLSALALALAFVAGSAHAQSVYTNNPGLNQTLDDVIVERLASNSATRGLYVQVDTWNGLAILHGWTLTNQQRRAVEEVVRGIEGVDRVYNYMISDADHVGLDESARKARSIQVTASNMNDQILDTGIYSDLTGMPVTEFTSSLAVDPVLPPPVTVVAVPDRLSQIVKFRLDIQPFTGMHEIRVDGYNGLVILHGQAPSLRFQREAESIAAHTAGVKQVFSYITTPEQTEPVLDPWPVLVELDHEPRRGAVRNEPMYARFEDKVEVKTRGNCSPCDR
ncbi:MAG TPA: BON domain-containing protein [Planctomycetota bacterium]|nr:BON domain-containing protein [Planctomycetota bacterium]